jgi:hypothetical protein
MRKQLENALLTGSLSSGEARLFIRSSVYPGHKDTTPIRHAFLYFACVWNSLYRDGLTVHEFSEGNIAADGVVHQNIHEGSQPKRTRVSRYRATTKQATTKDKQCPFSFTVFLGPDYFWYLSVGWATKDCSRHDGISL